MRQPVTSMSTTKHAQEPHIWISYLPFRGLSAWFSSSVNPALCKKWGEYRAPIAFFSFKKSTIPVLDNFGGILAGEGEADYLFSDNTFSSDTVRCVLCLQRFTYSILCYQ